MPENHPVTAAEKRPFLLQSERAKGEKDDGREHKIG
jgi:hypothetical protein